MNTSLGAERNFDRLIADFFSKWEPKLQGFVYTSNMILNHTLLAILLWIASFFQGISAISPGTAAL